MRRVLLSGTDTLGYAAACLRPYIGPVADVADHRALVDAVLSEYCLGYIAEGKDILSLIRAYGIPSDVGKDIRDKITQSLLRTIQSSFGFIYPSRQYSYYWLNEEDVVVEENLPTEQPFPQVIPNDPTVEALEDGGWVSERTRRALGVP